MTHALKVLIDGLRSLALLKPRPDAFVAPLSAHLAVYLLYVLMMAGFETAMADAPRTFEIYGVSSVMVGLCVTLGLLSLLPFSRNGASPERILLGSVATGLPILAAATVVVIALKAIIAGTSEEVLSSGSMGLLVAVVVTMVWGTVVMFRLIFGMADSRRVPLALGGIAILIVSPFILPNVSMIQGGNQPQSGFSLAQLALEHLRPAPEAQAATAKDTRPPIDGEAVMMRQHALVADAVGTLAPARASQAELYFVGFAPYSWHDVFKREVTAVKALFDERFGTAGRSIILQNHRESLGDIPLASISNLETVLGQIGQRMQRDRDVLVLFVTSHGNTNVISVSMEGVRLNNLTPARLTKALDGAGIKNRVLILSACYSGSFVPPLSDENTMILTAARADRTSFGCSNEREWTYFGDAFFNHALRQERTFVAAYERARDLVETWEKEQGLVASEPQIFVGDAIRDKIDGILASRLAD
jgi:hypothetical protein